MRKIVAGILIAFSLQIPAVYAQNDNMSITLRGKAYRYEWRGFENAVMVIQGNEYSVLENEYIENVTAVLKIPTESFRREFKMSGTRVHYHLTFESEKIENAFGIVPEYAYESSYPSSFGWGRRAKKFRSGLPKEYIVDKYGKLGGAEFTGYKVENYWYLSGTIVDDEGDNLFSSYSVTSLILENRGSMGPAPSGTSFSALTKKVTYYAVNIRAQILGVLGSTFWHNWGIWLTQRYDIVKQIRRILAPYVP